MVVNRLASFFGLRVVAAAAIIALAAGTFAQDAPPAVPPVVQKITADNTKVEMTVNASRILTMDDPIPRRRSGTPTCWISPCSRKTRCNCTPKKPV